MLKQCLPINSTHTHLCYEHKITDNTATEQCILLITCNNNNKCKKSNNNNNIVCVVICWSLHLCQMKSIGEIWTIDSLTNVKDHRHWFDNETKVTGEGVLSQLLPQNMILLMVTSRQCCQSIDDTTTVTAEIWDYLWLPVEMKWSTFILCWLWNNINAPKATNKTLCHYMLR